MDIKLIKTQVTKTEQYTFDDCRFRCVILLEDGALKSVSATADRKVTLEGSSGLARVGELSYAAGEVKASCTLDGDTAAVIARFNEVIEAVKGSLTTNDAGNGNDGSAK